MKKAKPNHRRSARLRVAFTEAETRLQEMPLEMMKELGLSSSDRRTAVDELKMACEALLATDETGARKQFDVSTHFLLSTLSASDRQMVMDKFTQMRRATLGTFGRFTPASREMIFQALGVKLPCSLFYFHEAYQKRLQLESSHYTKAAGQGVVDLSRASWLPTAPSPVAA